MNHDFIQQARQAGRLLRLSAGVICVVLLASCATKPAVQEERMAWPGPPLQPRIQFVRSLFSEEDVGQDETFQEKVINILAGQKPAANRIAEPMGLAVSDDGSRLYVADYAQLAVFVFDFAHKKFIKIGKDAPLGRPIGVALDAQENLYVVEQEKKAVSVFDRSGGFIRSFTDPSIEKPGGIAIDRARGRIYVADTSHTKSEHHTVMIFDLNGKLVGTLGKGKGSAEGQFLFPTYLSVDKQGNVYVTDTLNSRIQKFDPDGKFVRRIGERGTSFGMFDKPKGSAVDSFGNLYVVDSGWSNVQLFNPLGQILIFFGGRGINPGLLQNPAPITIDAKNRIYVGDYLNHRIEIYDLVNTKAEDSFIDPPPKADSKPAANPVTK